MVEGRILYFATPQLVCLGHKYFGMRLAINAYFSNQQKDPAPSTYASDSRIHQYIMLLIVDFVIIFYATDSRIRHYILCY